MSRLEQVLTSFMKAMAELTKSDWLDNYLVIPDKDGNIDLNKLSDSHVEELRYVVGKHLLNNEGIKIGDTVEVTIPQQVMKVVDKTDDNPSGLIVIPLEPTIITDVVTGIRETTLENESFREYRVGEHRDLSLYLDQWHRSDFVKKVESC